MKLGGFIRSRIPRSLEYTNVCYASVSTSQIEITTEFHFVFFNSPKECSQALLLHGAHLGITIHRDGALSLAITYIDGCHPELPLRNVWPREESERWGLDDIIRDCLELGQPYGKTREERQEGRSGECAEWQRKGTECRCKLHAVDIVHGITLTFPYTSHSLLSNSERQVVSCPFHR